MLLSLLTLWLLGLGPMPTANGGTPSRFRYVGWIGNDVLSIERQDGDISRGRMEYGNDVGFDVEFCEESSDFICFFSALHAFAVPKRLNPTERSWTVRGIKFELVGEDLTISLFGRRLGGLYLIRTPADATVLGRQTGKPAFSLFSPTNGLVGLYLYRELRTYWMDGAYGFGASPAGDLVPSTE